MARRNARHALEQPAPPPTGPIDPIWYPRSYHRNILKAFSIDLTTGKPRTRLGTWVVHRGGGKTLTVLAGIIVPAMCARSGTFFHVFPTYQQAKKAVWDKKVDEGPQIGKLYRDFFPAGFVESMNETELQVTMKPIGSQRSGSIYQLVGMDTPRQVDMLRSTGPLGIVYDEYQLMQRYAYDVVRTRLAQIGGWALFVGTPNGEGPFKEMYEICRQAPDAFAELLTIETTRRDAPGEDGRPVVSPEEVERMLSEGMRREFIQQELYCSFTGFLHGTIYGDCLMRARAEGRITRVVRDVSAPVGLLLDIGRTDCTAIWFYQRIGREIRFIDYYANRLKGPDHYAHVLKEEKPYQYERMVLPHDAGSLGFMSVETAEAYFKRVGFRGVEVAQKLSVQQGIDAVRLLFPRFVFDEMACSRAQADGLPSGLESLERYASSWNDEKKDFSGPPVQNQFTHGADSLRTGANAGLDRPLEFLAPRTQTHARMDFNPVLAFGESRQHARSLL